MPQRDGTGPAWAQNQGSVQSGLRSGRGMRHGCNSRSNWGIVAMAANWACRRVWDCFDDTPGRDPDFQNQAALEQRVIEQRVIELEDQLKECRDIIAKLSKETGSQSEASSEITIPVVGGMKRDNN